MSRLSPSPWRAATLITWKTRHHSRQHGARGGGDSTGTEWRLWPSDKRRLMRLKLPILFSAILAVTVAHGVLAQKVAQAPAPTDPATGVPLFSVLTRLVQVDAIVRDKNGPITGLTKADFTVLDNGMPQQI